MKWENDAFGKFTEFLSIFGVSDTSLLEIACVLTLDSVELKKE